MAQTQRITLIILNFQEPERQVVLIQQGAE